MKTIQEIKEGYTFDLKYKGKATVIMKTPRTITSMFENGNTVKITYRHKDAYFYPSDFDH